MKTPLSEGAHIKGQILFPYKGPGNRYGKPRRQCVCRASSKQQKSLIEPSAATKVRVERQTHLPASREEAWGALKQLAPGDAWEELSPLLAAMESIYR